MRDEPKNGISLPGKMRQAILAILGKIHGMRSFEYVRAYSAVGLGLTAFNAVFLLGRESDFPFLFGYSWKYLIFLGVYFSGAISVLLSTFRVTRVLERASHYLKLAGISLMALATLMLLNPGDNLEVTLFFVPLQLVVLFGWNPVASRLPAVMEMPTGRFLRLAAANLLVLLILLSLVEFGSRFLVKEPDLIPDGFKFNNFTMFTMDGPLDATYRIKDANLDVRVRTNNLGFRIDMEMDLFTRYDKRQNEKVVLLTGGSAAFGIGATDNDTTIAGQLQQELNSRQQTNHYTVFNLASGGWIAYQEFLALDLYGKNLDPDWIVAMDGRNDGFVSILHGHGPGEVSNTIKAYINGYLYRQNKPSFYRGWLENEIVRYSHAYRLLTGKSYVVNTLGEYDPIHWSDVDKTISFYIHSLESILNVCGHCKVILSTQPLANFNSKEFLPPGDNLQSIADIYRNAEWYVKERPGYSTAIDIDDETRRDFVVYFYSVIIDKAQALCERDPSRCQFFDIGMLFPDEVDSRWRFFVDSVHLNNAGQAKIAQFYADKIIEADLGSAAELLIEDSGVVVAALNR